MATSGEQYELFLMLAGPRVGAARSALELRGSEPEAGLAVVQAAAQPAAALEAALSELDAATEALGHGDASGARVDETRLHEVAIGLVLTMAFFGDRPSKRHLFAALPFALLTGISCGPAPR